MPKRKAAAEAAKEEVAAAPSWSDLTIAELKTELDRRSLSKSGNKAKLVARLEAADNGTLPAGELAGRPKKAKVEAGSDEDDDGAPLASELILNKDASSSGEKRLRPFVPAPDDVYKNKLKRIRKERMFMLDRERTVDRHGFPCEKFDIAGSTGNIYQTTIGRSPSCVCMDARTRGQKCKHINYALIIILKAPAHLCYQLAFLSSELETIFANAPVTRAPAAAHDHDNASVYDGKRKPVDGECPICVFDMEPGEELVWCKAACGQNFHKTCFEQWKASRGSSKVTCVYCRSEWLDDVAPKKAKAVPGSLASLKEDAPKIGRYKNIGHLPMYKKG